MASKTNVKIHGLPGSANCMGAVLFASDHELGALDMTPIGPDGTQKPEYLKKFPYHQIPALTDDANNLTLAESNAILRYLGALSGDAETQKLLADPAKAAHIDWALATAGGPLYQATIKVLYPVLGYLGPQDDADKPKTAAALTDQVQTYLKLFNVDSGSGKVGFLGGASKPTIADYKVAPFFYSLTHEAVAKDSGFAPSQELKDFVALFLEKSASKGQLEVGGGWALKELLDKKL